MGSPPFLPKCLWVYVGASSPRPQPSFSMITKARRKWGVLIYPMASSWSTRGSIVEPHPSPNISVTFRTYDLRLDEIRVPGWQQ